MAIATIVTRGFGSFGSIGDIVTRGFLADPDAVQVRTTGASYLTREEYEAALDRQRTLDNARKRAQRKHKARIRDAVIAALNPQPEPAPEPQGASVAAVVPPPAPMAPQLAPPPPDAKLAAINTEMKRIRAKLAAYEAEQAEDDDIETLLMLIH